MVAYSLHSAMVSLHFAWESAVAISLPLDSSLFQLALTFPFNVILAMAAMLVVGIILALTRKPARSNKEKGEVKNKPTREAKGETPKFTGGDNSEGNPVRVVEEEIPRSFEGPKDGVVKLYNWFYSFAQWRLEGIAENLTPREFLSVVSGRIPSEGSLALEYLVTSFEIANYSKTDLTEEILSKCLKGVEVLKDLIEGGGSRVADDAIELDEASIVHVTHNL